MHSDLQRARCNGRGIASNRQKHLRSRGFVLYKTALSGRFPRLRPPLREPESIHTYEFP